MENPIGFFSGGTRVTLTIQLAYKYTSSLQHPIMMYIRVKWIITKKAKNKKMLGGDLNQLLIGFF